MESIPEIPDRRLSETGARRGSDNSVVLTEDTDSFIIGDHVWVGGTKPGQIAYIGETQFAPGDWAGIVLDEPIGKNDGSVAGCRYFQCEPKRGIFSRLTRLTRLPMSGAITSPSTPTESVKGSLNKSMSPSLNTSTTSLASVTHQKELQLGERVIVSSGQGSKTGVLRFMGTTDFAPGEWCGVELDEPLGKNDGSVGDKRYFECRPKHGLFAPAHKVSRSPSSKRSMAPSVHRPMGASLNASLARSKAGSRESLASMSSMASAVSRATTTASTARLQRPGLMRTSTPVRKTPQETLKDKQKEIEALRKERDLERERMTKAASQADAAEKTVIILKKEYEKYREEAEKAAQETQNTLAKLLEERNLFSTQLEEERRKCEDLLFRFEEESINKDDIQVANTIHENKIKDLEKQLSEERERVIQLERDSTKLFEVEEELTKLRTEIQNSAANEKSELSGLEKRNVDLEKLRGQLEKLLDEKNKTVAQYVTEIDEINKRLKEKEQENISQEEYKSNLRKQLEEITKELQEKLAYIDEFQNQFKGQTENLQKEIKGLKETIQNISEQNASERIKLIEEHKKILQSKEEILKSKASELKNESQKLFASHEGTLEQLKLENSRQIKELSESFKSQLNVKDTYIKQISSQLDEKVLNINNISIELSELKDACIAKENEIQKVSTDLEDLNIKLKGYDDKNCSLNKEIERLQIQHEDNIKTVTEQKAKLEGEVSSLATEIDSLKNKMKKLDECLKIKDLELSKIRNSKNEELESLKVQFEEKLEDKSKYIQEVKAEASEKSSRLIVLETELENLKSVVATKDEEIQNLSKKTSELRDALTLSEETKTNLESELKMYESNFAELNQKFDRAEGKISQLTNQKEKLEVEISTIVNTSMDSSEQLVKYNEDLRQKEKELDEARDREFNLQKLISTAESKSNATEEELNKANLLIDQFKLENEEIQTKLLSTEHELQALSAKILVNQTTEQKLIKTNKDFEESLNKRSAELADLRNSLKTYENNNLQLQKDLADAIEQYNKEKLQFERQIGEGENDQIALKENILTLEQLNKQLLTDQQGMESSVKELKQKISDKNTYLLELESLIKSKDVQIKENIANLECFKLEKEELKKNTLDLSTKYNDILTELTLLKSSNISLETQMSLEVANLKQQLEDEKNTLDTALKESKNSLDELTKELVTVSESEAKSSQKRLELESIIVTKEKEIQVLNEVLNSEKQNTETIKKDLQTLNETIAEKNNDILSNASLISSLKQKIVTTESSISTLKDDLENKIKFVAELQNRLDDMEQLNIDTANIDDKKREREIDELKKKYEHQLMSKDGVITELNGVIENREKIVQEFTSQQKSANELIKNYEEELVFKDKIIVDLKTVNETTKNANKDYENTKRLVDELTLKHADEIKLKDKVISELQEAAKEVNERIQNFIEQINFANERCSQLEETQRQRENDYKQLEISYNEAIAKLNIMKENIKNSTNNDLSNHKVLNLKTEENVKSTIGGSNSELEHFKEEYALARSQIEFLNSVIVEMQRKNEALLCKVEVLEMGIPTEEADDYNLNLIEKKTQSCRMFCDICDQFDLHESEDCPRQAQDAEPPPRPINSEKKLPKPRPYCENCEIFGHDTSACKDTETY